MLITVPKTDNLKAYLEGLGYLFPCGGKGLCGRCKIIAPTLEITSLDKRFLSENELSSGTRLACDKIIANSTEIDCDLKKKPKEIKPEHPCIYAIFEDNTTEIGITDDGIILENILLPSPEPNKQDLKGILNFRAIEMFEKYKIAKAETILVLGTPKRIKELTGLKIPFNYGDMYFAIDYNLPGEDLYIPAIPLLDMGSSDLVELLNLPHDSLLISKSLFMYKGDDILCVNIAEDLSSDLRKRAFSATLEYLVQTFEPEHIYTFENNKNVIDAGGLLIEKRARYIAAELLISNKKKAELNKLAKRIVTMSLADDDKWQSIFSAI